jgi:hypothetical protein
MTKKFYEIDSRFTLLKLNAYFAEWQKYTLILNYTGLYSSSARVQLPPPREKNVDFFLESYQQVLGVFEETEGQMGTEDSILAPILDNSLIDVNHLVSFLSLSFNFFLSLFSFFSFCSLLLLLSSPFAL